MGSAVSAGTDNDELTDNLCDADYIRTAQNERLFRAVDRGEYILPEHRMNAYRDQAWRCNHLHLSAPCIYSEVLEGLSLGSGMSFLNLGSGTGYLSTLAGLMLGCNGINHGVEYYEDVIQYANKKLEDFKRFSGAIDEFDFCEPKFLQGNCLCLTNDRRYDRVYVGAACPVPFDAYLKSFIKVGGILVMPFNDQLLQIRRLSETNWVAASLLPVSFATLILPKEESKDTYELMDIQPDSLQSLCRNKVRNILRANVEFENPEICRPAERQRKYPHKQTISNHRVCRRGVNSSLMPFDQECQNQIRNISNISIFSQIVSESDSSSDEATTDDNANESTDNNAGSAINDQDPDAAGNEDEETVTMQPSSPASSENSNQENKAVYYEISSQGQSSTSTANMEATATSTSQSAEVEVQENNQTPKSDQQRRKFDSGIGDEESNDDEPNGEGQAQTKRTKLNWFNKWLKSDKPERSACDSSSTSSCDTIEVDNDNDDLIVQDEENEDDPDDSDHDTIETDMDFYNKRRTVDSPYTEHMCKKINELPLPPSLKNFLNFYRF